MREQNYELSDKIHLEVQDKKKSKIIQEKSSEN